MTRLLSTTSGYIGYNSNSVGLVTVDGAGSTWTNSGSLYVGNSGSGTLSITNHGSITGTSGYLGSSSGSTGLVTVDGAGSTWTNSVDLYVGKSGSGTLSIVNGGAVSVAGTTYVGFGASSTGAVKFGTSGGTLTTRSLLVSPTQLAGTGTINTSGLVSDINLIFDSAHGLKQTFPFQQSGQNISVNLDMATTPANNGASGAGSVDRIIDHSIWGQDPIQRRLCRLQFWLNGYGNGGRKWLEVDR